MVEQKATMELRVRVGVKKGEKILGGVESRDTKGRNGRRVRGHHFHDLREDAAGSAII